MAVQELDRIQQVGIRGGGIMGLGIAEIVAKAGIRTTVVEIDDNTAERARELVVADFGAAVQKGKMTEDQKGSALGNLIFTSNVSGLRDADLVIEAVPENLKLKQGVFAELDRVLPEHAVIFTNTSSLPVGKLASSTNRPENVGGMHFFNPAARMKLVEIARAEGSSDETIQLARDLAEKLGKTPVYVTDSPGFVVNRLLVPYLVVAADMVQDENGKQETRMKEIDQVMREQGGVPMGPFALADLIGIDTTLAVYEILQKAFPDQYKNPPQILRKLVENGHLGRKTGKGFYTYSSTSNGSATEIDIPDDRAKEILVRLQSSLIDGAVHLANEGVATPEDIDNAMKLGTSMSQGPFELKAAGKS